MEKKQILSIILLLFIRPIFRARKIGKTLYTLFFVVFFLFVILFWCGIIMCGSYFEWELNQLAIEAQPSKQSSSSSLFQQQTHEYTNGNSTLRVVTIYNPQLTSHILKMCSSQHLVERKTHIFDKIERFTFCPSNQICIQCETCPTYKHIHTRSDCGTKKGTRNLRFPIGCLYNG